MIYPPPHHTEPDEARVFDAIDAIRHATLVIIDDGQAHVAFTPFLLDRERRLLRGHIARRNPQVERLDGRRAEAIFHGPHAYISPRLNHNDDVPTWNYVNVHVTGKAHAVHDADAKWSLLQDLVHALEGANARPYLDHYSKTLRKKLNGITGVELSIERVQGRFKLGRNDPPELQRKTFSALAEETAPSLRRWLETLAPGAPAAD